MPPHLRQDDLQACHAHNAPSEIRGCRIGHEICAGQATIQIRAGSIPPDGRDDRIQFQTDVGGLEQVIDELVMIWGELTARKEAAHG